MTYSTDNTLAVAPAVASWLAERVPEAAAAGGADALARGAAAFSFNSFGVKRDGRDIMALYERNAKVAHACNWAGNVAFTSPGKGERGGMLTLAPLAPKTPLLNDYMGGTDALFTTTAQRHMLRRSKGFDCFCKTCTAPDELAALPCPDCVPRDPETGLVPLLMGQARALKPHPVVVPDGVSPAEASTPPAWRCNTCNGVFPAERLAAVQIAAGVARPAPRTTSMKFSKEPASLLDVARWAEAATVQTIVELPHSDMASDFERKSEHLMKCVMILAPIVGTAHASVLRLRYAHIKALHLATIEMQGGVYPTAADMTERLCSLVPLLDSQLPALFEADPRDAGRFMPPALASAIVAAVEGAWPRLRAAGLLRDTCTNTLPVNFVCLAIQLVQALGMNHEPDVVRCVTVARMPPPALPECCSDRSARDGRPLRAMLRELPPMVGFSENMQMIVKKCSAMVGE